MLPIQKVTDINDTYRKVQKLHKEYPAIDIWTPMVSQSIMWNPLINKLASSK